MTVGATYGRNRNDLKRRRHEMERLLSDHGLLRGDPRYRRAEEDTAVCRLQTALQELGPIFALFGRYLASRADLIPLRDCLALDAVPDRPSVLSPETVFSLFRSDLGQTPDRIFLSFEDTPWASRLLFQMHRARLPDGTPVNVRIRRPVETDQIETDCQLLSGLRAAFVSVGWPGLPVEEVTADFRRMLSRSPEEAMGFEDLEGLAADAEVFDLLAVPRLYRDYSSGAIRTYERLAGWTLEEVIAGIQTTTSSKRPPRSDPLETLGLDADDVARRICLVWLRQALYGSMYPVDVHPGDIVVLSTHQIAFTGGLFATLPPLTRENLFNYLVASAARDPDRAYDGLMREMEETSRARGERALRNRFRQVVPFRDGPWSQTGDGDTLAEHLLVYWRIAREHGYHVRIPTLDFYRGLFAVTRHVQRLAPARDALKEGLEDLRFSVGISEIREMMDVDLWRDTMNKYATSMLQLPYLLNEVLSKTPGEHLRAPRPSARSTRSIRPVSALMGLLCLLVATAVVARHLTRTLGENVWVQGISAGIFVLAGLLMLRMIYRR